MSKIIFPKSLNKGDAIAIVSPAGAVEEKDLQSTLNLIKSQGYEPILGKYTLGKFDQSYPYSGTEKERIADFNWALNDSDISAIWASRGGYGCQHLLRHLNLSRFRKQPKWYIGYSDNTVIQSFLLKNNFASIHGQTVKTANFGVADKSYCNIFKILNGALPTYEIKSHLFNKEGEATGVLVGGNLALVYALLGTPYSFNFKDKILFIEDIGEQFYALDRMLMALDLAGAFRKIKGVIIGGMTNMGNKGENPRYDNSFDTLAYEIIYHRLEKYNIPTIFAFPNGHIYENYPLILGAKISIRVNKTISKLIF